MHSAPKPCLKLKEKRRASESARLAVHTYMHIYTCCRLKKTVTESVANHNQDDTCIQCIIHIWFKSGWYSKYCRLSLTARWITQYRINPPYRFCYRISFTLSPPSPHNDTTTILLDYCCIAHLQAAPTVTQFPAQDKNVHSSIHSLLLKFWSEPQCGQLSQYCVRNS